MLGFPSFLRLSNSPPCGCATGCLSVICPRTRGRFHLWVLWLRRWAWGEHLLSSGRCPVPDDVAAGPWALSLPWEALCQLKGSFSNKLQIGSTFLQWNKSSAAFDQHARCLGDPEGSPHPLGAPPHEGASFSGPPWLQRRAGQHLPPLAASAPPDSAGPLGSTHKGTLR